MPPSWVLSPGHSALLSLVCLHFLQLSSVAILRCVHECIDLAICPSFCLRLWCHAAAGTVSERVYSGLPNMSQGQCLLGCLPLPGGYRAGHAASPHPAPDGLPAPVTRSGHVVRVANMRSVYSIPQCPDVWHLLGAFDWPTDPDSLSYWTHNNNARNGVKHLVGTASLVWLRQWSYYDDGFSSIFLTHCG